MSKLKPMDKLKILLQSPPSKKGKKPATIKKKPNDTREGARKERV